MISLDDRLRVSHQFTKWARENRLELSPSKFLAYLDAKGYLNAELMIEDSKKMACNAAGEKMKRGRFTFDYTLGECTKNNMCVDCDDDSCRFKGNLRADCPKYHCDSLAYEDCESCLFMKKYAESQREYYKQLQQEGEKCK